MMLVIRTAERGIPLFLRRLLRVDHGGHGPHGKDGEGLQAIVLRDSRLIPCLPYHYRMISPQTAWIFRPRPRPRPRMSTNHALGSRGRGRERGRGRDSVAAVPLWVFRGPDLPMSLPLNCQSGSWVHGAKKFGDVFVGSFVGSFVEASTTRGGRGAKDGSPLVNFESASR